MSRKTEFLLWPKHQHIAQKAKKSKLLIETFRIFIINKSQFQSNPPAQVPASKPSKIKWLTEEDNMLLNLKNENSAITFSEICAYLPNKSMKQIENRYKKLIKGNSRRYWSREEDLRLIDLIDMHGENFTKLVEFFQDKSATEIEARYYKKIKHLKLGFTPEEDAIILKLYRNRQLSFEELRLIKGKGADEIKKRIESLLSTVGEEIDKSFNASSILSSSFSYSSATNLDHKGMICDEDNLPDHTSNFNHKSQYKDTQATFHNESHYTSNSFNKPFAHSYPNFSKQFTEDYTLYNNHLNNEFDVFNTDLYNNNINWNFCSNSNKDKDLSDCYSFPVDLNDSYIQRLNEPEDSFEASFYTAFKLNGNENYLDLSEDNDFEKALNHHSKNTVLMSLFHKKKSLEQILNKVHAISEACYFEKDIKAKCTLTEENFQVFKELYQKLIYQEEEFKQSLVSHKHTSALQPLNINQDSDQELMKQLSAQIDLLMKLIKVNKLKLKLFKRAVLNKT